MATKDLTPFLFYTVRMPSFDTLHASYQKLGEADQIILRVLSVVYESVNQTTLNKILTDVYRLDKNYRVLDLNMDKETRYRLEARGLIDIKANKLRCNRYIEEWLTIETLSSGEYAGFLGAALDHVPIVAEHQHYLLRNAPKDDRRELRYALYSGKPDLILKHLHISDPYENPGYEYSNDLVDICATPMHGDWFATLPVAIQYQVLRPILQASLLNWSDSTVFYGLLNEMVAALEDPHPALMELVAEQRLYRGEWQSLNEYLGSIGSRHAEQLTACLHFFEGRTSESLASFQQFIARVRKETRKRNVAVTGMPGVVYLLALLKDQNPENLKLAEQQFKFASNQTDAADYYNEMLILDRVREVNEGKKTFTSDAFDLSFAYFQPLTTLINGLALLWNNQKPDKSFLSSLTKKNAMATEAGYDWFANECSALLAQLSNKPYKPEKLIGPPLTEVIPRQEDWERSLKALINVPMSTASKKARKKSTGSEAMRLAWLLEEDYMGFELKPKEQKQKKNGSWTVGRNIALKRLQEEPERFAYLTEADKKICRCIRQTREYNHYGYSKIVYSLASLKALLAAEGHPYLFRASEPGLSVEISSGTPELQVVEQGNDIRLALEPYPFERNYLIDEETPERYRIYQYSSELKHIAQILGEQGLTVPKAARDKVLESVSAIAPLLTVHSDIEGITDQHAQMIEADTRLYVHLQPLEAGLRLSFQVQPFTSGPVLTPGRGGESLFAEIDGRQLQTKRDLNGELARLQEVLGTCNNLYEYAPNEWRWQETDEALEGLLALQSLGDDVVLSWPAGKEIRLSKTVGLSDMTVTLRQKTDWFEMDGELKIDNQQVYSMQAVLELVSASNSRFIELADGQFLTLTTELKKRLDELGSYTDKQRVHSLNAINLEASIEGMEVDADKAWGQFKKRLQKARELEPQLPSTLQADLRDYQLLGYNWLCRLSEWGAGACLADDMGLGKTLQALAMIVNRAALGPTLVLAPTSVCMNWIDEATRFAPTLKPIRFGSGNRKETLKNLKPYDLLICSYGLLQSEAKQLQAIHWTTVVADEAQAFKNAATKRSKSVMALKGDFKMIATGTPIENHLGELWNLFQFINPGLLGSREVFNNKFAYPIENQKDANASNTLKRLISPFILRRLKRDVLKELPPRTEITLRVDLSKEETALYEALRLEAVSQMKDVDIKPNEQRMQALASITRLRRAVCNPNMVLRDANLPSAKLEMFEEVVRELLENKHKALVFSQFVEHLKLIRTHLDKLGISYQYLDGSTTTKKRTEAVNAFQSGNGDLFLISLKAGGVGLNLTAADYVIHMDPWWNPAVEDQASDRAHRIGQQRPVTVYRIVANNTIEEKIVALHAQKRDLADRLLEGSEISAKMSLDDMLQLLD